MGAPPYGRSRTLTATRLAAASLVIALVVLALKGAAAWVTGSVALLADAAESVVNVVASAAALAAILYSAKPADANHPYGHAKAEYFSAVLEGALIIVAAGFILHQAWEGFLSPRMPDQPLLGLAINGGATLINLVWARTLLSHGSRLGSPALIADGRHVMTDVVTSVGVFAGVALVAATGTLWIDPALAALTALNILWSGARLVRESVGGLMDEAVPPAMLDRIRRIVAEHAEGAIEAHDIRTRHAGRFTFIEFHLVVPGEMRVDDAHEICDRVEEALKDATQNAIVTIHLEPPHKAKHKGVVVLPALLAALLAAPAQAQPQRIVSLNLCADQLVVLLVEPGRIAGLSPLAADPSLSAVAGRVAGITRVRPVAEAVLPLDPDLAVAGAWGARGVEPLLRARGVPVLRLALAEDFDAIAAQTRAVGNAVGEAARADALVAAMRATLASLPPPTADPPRALLWQARGFAPGAGTLPDAVLRAAGFSNAAPFAGYGYVGVETLLSRPPALLITATRPDAPSLSHALLDHPALATAAIPRAAIDPALVACGSPLTALAAAALAKTPTPPSSALTPNPSPASGRGRSPFPALPRQWVRGRG